MKRRFRLLLVQAICLGSLLTGSGEARELLRDPHFQQGFYLLEPAPGRRVTYGQIGGFSAGKPVWDLAQWSSRFPLKETDLHLSPRLMVCSNAAKIVVVGAPGGPASDLSLGVNAGAEYPRARKSSAEPWVHLLVQQEFLDPPLLGRLSSLKFLVEARLKQCRLANTNGYSPALHAAQYLIYLTVANRNPKAAGYQECFWFGIPVYDNRERVVPAYEAQDFGDTKLFIFTLSSDVFTSRSAHDKEWIVLGKDLLPLMRRGIEHAHAKGFFKGSRSDPADFCPLGIFIGWEVPGTFDSELQIRNLSLQATTSGQGG